MLNPHCLLCLVCCLKSWRWYWRENLRTPKCGVDASPYHHYWPPCGLAPPCGVASCANQLPQQHFLNNRSSRRFLPVKPREMNLTIYINAGDEGDTDDRGGRGWWGFQSSWRAPGFRPIIPHPKSPAREIPCQKLFTVCWDFSGLKTSSCLSLREGRTIVKASWCKISLSN